MDLLHSEQIKEGKRFSFGENWAQFLKNLNEDRIRKAEKSLCQKLDVENLQGKRFLDIGSGSGLFSLAARRLGATVHSFDYDPESVACTLYLKEKFFPDDDDWVVESGSVLDKEYLDSLGQWDVVYSWGVLHHTGNMQQAFENVSDLVVDRGKLFIAIYNDQGGNSRRWLKVKQIYNKLPSALRGLVLVPAFIVQWGPATLRDFLIGKPFHTARNYGRVRGMSLWRDVVDWVGGLPFEVASPEEVFRFFKRKGFRIEEFTTQAGGSGCNEFVFRRERNMCVNKSLAGLPVYMLFTEAVPFFDVFCESCSVIA